MNTKEPRPPIPAILLEGDAPAPPQIAQPPAKGAASPAPPVKEPKAPADDLPESYGSGQLHAIARDPHSIYTHWDPPPATQGGPGDVSAPQPLVVRVHAGPPAGQPVGEVRSDPGARHWFVPVERAGQNYSVEIGTYQPGGEWKSMAVSGPVATPPDARSEDWSLHLAKVGPDFARSEPLTPEFPPIPPPAEMYLPVAPETTIAPVADAPSPPSPRASRTAWIPALDSDPGEAGSIANPAETGAPLSVFESPQESSGPFPLEGFLAYEQTLAALAGLASVQFAYPNISSPSGGAPWTPRGFRFDINAELVLYGGTEPDARLTIGGQPVELRPDGTFSHRFALPDGIQQLAVIAVSPQGDWRQAEFSFIRQTEYAGGSSDAPTEPMF